MDQFQKINDPNEKNKCGKLLGRQFSKEQKPPELQVAPSAQSKILQLTALLIEKYIC